jgi:hypothetical protein
MESKYNITEIMTQVGDIGELISRMDTDGPVPAIDIDIVQEKIRKLYADIGSLKQQDRQVMSPMQHGKKRSPEEKRTEKIKKSKAEKRRKEGPEVLKAPEVSEAPEVPGTIPEEDSAATPAPKPAGEPATLADKFKGEKDFINERLGSNGDRQDLSSRLQSKPIRNIGASLGLNDQFKLINELFEGNKDSYQQTISKLDSASTFEEAYHYITATFDWDMEDESVQMLLNLIRRKFIVNRDE